MMVGNGDRKSSEVKRYNYSSITKQDLKNVPRFATMEEEELMRQLQASRSAKAHLIGLIGASVEFTWAVQEACIVPYLLFLDMPLRWVGMAYVGNPTIGVFLQPYIGKRSDASGRRKPYILVLSILGEVGLLLLLNSYALGGGLSDYVIPIALLGFTISDVAHDCLLVPARSIVEDRENLTHASFTRLQMIGRLLPLLVGSFPLEYLLPGFLASKLPEEPRTVRHMMSLVFLSALFLGVNSMLVLFFVPPSTELFQDEEEESEEEDEVKFEIKRQKVASENTALLLFKRNNPSLSEFEPSPSHGHVRKNSLFSMDTFYVNRRFVVFLFAHFTGWFACMISVFYWTAFVGDGETNFLGLRLNVAYLGLSFSALCSVLCTIVIRKLNKRFGRVHLYFAGEFINAAGLILLNYVGNGMGSVFVSAAFGIFYTTHSNNPFVIFSSEDDEDTGWTISLITAMMPAAQIAVGLFSGIILEKGFNGDFGAFFETVGEICLIVSMICYLLLRKWKFAHGPLLGGR